MKKTIAALAATAAIALPIAPAHAESYGTPSSSCTFNAFCLHQVRERRVEAFPRLTCEVRTEQRSRSLLVDGGVVRLGPWSRWRLVTSQPCPTVVE